MTRTSTQVLSSRRRMLATAATLTMVAGVGATTIAPANAATAECGPGCISVFSSELGTYTDVKFVEAVLDDGDADGGEEVGLKARSGTDPPEDFLPGGDENAVAGKSSTVSDFYADGMVSAKANRRYGPLNAVQQKYTPHGVETGLCVGVEHVRQGEDLTLLPCDVPGKTVWIVYTTAQTPANYFAIVNAATTDFRRPFAMHLPRHEVARGGPELQMELRHLQFRH